MKAQFKYSFLAGLYTRGAAFAVIAAMMLVFGILGSLDLLAYPAHVTAVSLGGVSIAVMLAVNIISDVAITRRMASAPDAYLYALTPAPRRKTLLASVITMMIMDLVTLAVVIFGEVWLAMNLAGEAIWAELGYAVRIYYSEILWNLAVLICAYLLIVLVLLFGVAAGKSVFHKKAASRSLGFLLACASLYIANLMWLILAPFANVERHGVTIVLQTGRAGTALYILLLLLQAAALFVLTSRLMERKMNI